MSRQLRQDPPAPAGHESKFAEVVRARRQELEPAPDRAGLSCLLRPHSASFLAYPATQGGSNTGGCGEVQFYGGEFGGCLGAGGGDVGVGYRDDDLEVALELGLGA